MTPEELKQKETERYEWLGALVWKSMKGASEPDSLGALSDTEWAFLKSDLEVKFSNDTFNLL